MFAGRGWRRLEQFLSAAKQTSSKKYGAAGFLGKRRVTSGRSINYIEQQVHSMDFPQTAAEVESGAESAHDVVDGRLFPATKCIELVRQRRPNGSPLFCGANDRCWPRLCKNVHARKTQ